VRHGTGVFALVIGFGAQAPTPSDVVAQVAEWRVDPTPAVSAGDGPGEGHDLLFVRDAMLLPDGRLLVLSDGTDDLRLFSPDGRFIRSIGRQGEGPGEFDAPFGFTRTPAGHLLVYDAGNLRVTDLDSDFEVVGTERVAYDRTAMAPTSGRVRPFESGVVAVARRDVPFFESTRREEGRYEDDLVITMLRGTEAIASLRRSGGATYQVREGSVGLRLPLPMGEFALFNWGRSRVVVGASHTNRFELFDDSATLVGAVEAEGTPRRATAADMAAYDEKIRNEHRDRGGPLVIGGMTMPSTAGRVERFLDRAPRGDRVPMFDQVEIGDAGLVWVREYVLDGEEATWQVLDPATGGLVGRLTLSAAWEMLRPSPDALVVLERDALDVEIVRVYAIRR
jgi:hypothetical protein